MRSTGADQSLAPFVQTARLLERLFRPLVAALARAAEWFRRLGRGEPHLQMSDRWLSEHERHASKHRSEP